MKKKQTRTRSPRVAKAKQRASGGGALVKARGINPAVSLHLYVRAGGRCEFDGHNDYLMRHPTTSAIGNFAQQAHIYAFKEDGPRGRGPGRPRDVNKISNLMLLCGPCHHLVDKVEPEKYTVDILRKFKLDHEKRVFQLTGIAKDRDTIPLVMKAQIGGRTMEISDEEMQHASAPNYIRVADKVTIDLTALPDAPEPEYFQGAMKAIDAKMDEIGRLPPGKSGARRVSVFALAPIPLLVYLGSKLSDKWTVDLYQRRRTGDNPWTWEAGDGTAQYVVRRLKSGSGGAALLVNLSGRNEPDAFGAQSDDWTVYELTLDPEPSPVAVRALADLERFKLAYVRALALIRQAHPSITEVHLLAAVPAPVAICLGMLRLPKVDPTLVIFDRDKRAPGFSVNLRI